MHTKTMEGLIGARTNMDMTNVPMRVFKEARRKGDTATMERAMGYVNDFEDRAYQYKDTAEEGMKEEAEEARAKKKQELEEQIEKRREERKELESQREQERIESQKKQETNRTPDGTDNIEITVNSPADGNISGEAAPTLPKADTIEISPEGRALSEQSSGDKAVTLPDSPVFYSSSGSADTTNGSQSKGSKLNVSV